MRTRIAVLLVGLCGCISHPAAADDTWIEVKSPHFTVVSNSGEGRARNIAWQFEQIRAAIAAGWPWARVQLDRPILVVVAKDESTMKQLLPRYWEKGTAGDSRPVSVFATAANRHYITLRGDVRGDNGQNVNPYSASYWTYSSLALNAAFERPLPLWFRNGLAEVLSNSIVRDDELKFGLPIPWHIVALQQARIRLAELISLDANSPYYRDGETRRRFDAQVWGVMHYMLFGRPEDQSDGVNQLAKLLQEGKSSADAIREVFGSVEALEEAYLRYQKQPILQYSRMKVETNAASKSFPTRPLAPADTAAVRAGVHAATGRPDEARAMIADARKTSAQAPGSYDIEGLLLDREGKRDEAQSAFAKSVELKSDSFYSYYRLATMTWGPGITAETRASIETLLRRSIELNDSYAASYAFLADTIARGPKPADALDPAVRAATLDPSDSSVRLSVARVLWQLSRRDEAMGQARAALSLARSDQQRSQAQDLIAFFSRPR